MISSLKLIGLFSVLFWVAPSGLAQETQKVASVGSDPAASLRSDERYRIGYRDKLSVQVFRHADLNQNVTVNPNGTINLFRLSEPISAVCKTERELANDIAAAYRKDYLKNPEVQVVATEQLSQAVAVVGAVEKGGPFFLNRKAHLWEVIAFAGGPSKDAGSRVLVARGGSNANCQNQGPDTETEALYSFRIRDLQEGKERFIMQPGDIVSVLKADLIFVYGNVNKQGQVEMREPLTLTQAIVSAEGFKPASNKEKVRILRERPGSLEREEIVVDMNAVSKGKEQDRYLLPNDIVAVSEDRAKSIVNSVTRSFTQGLGGILVRGY